MKLCFRILAVAVIAASTYSLIGCTAPASFSYQNVSISLSAQCADCENSGIFVFYNPAYPAPPNPGSVAEMPPGGGQGGDTVFTATVTNAPANNITWKLYPQPNLGSIDNLPTGTSIPVGESGSGVGTISAASGATAVYHAPSGVPYYTGAALVQAQAMGIPQGDVLLVASVPADPSNPSVVASIGQLIQIVNGSNVYLVPHTNTSPAGLTNPVLTVPRNGSYQFYGGVIGTLPCASVVVCATQGFTQLYSTDNAPIWEVCPAPFSLTACIVGGNTTLGTITQTGLYTAPAAIPNPQPIILVTSHFAPNITNQNNYAIIAIN
jgi:hypothetical protein